MPSRLIAVLVFVSALLLSAGVQAEPGGGNGGSGGNGGGSGSDASGGNGAGGGGGPSDSGGRGSDSVGNSADGGDADDSGEKSDAAGEDGRDVDGVQSPERPAGLGRTPESMHVGKPAPAPAIGAAAGVPGLGVQQRSALEALRSGEAVPLEQLMPSARSGGAEVLDARLVSKEGSLVYELKVLSPDGTVSTQQFQARTGRPIERR